MRLYASFCGTSLALATVVILGAFAGCKKAEEKPATGDQAAASPAPAGATCAKVIDHVSELTLASPEMKAAPEAEQKMARDMIKGMRGEMLKQCEAGKPSQKELDCLLAAKDMAATQACGPLMAGKKDEPAAGGGADGDAGAGAGGEAATPVIGTTVEGLNDLDADKLVALFGAPATKSEVVEQGADGMFVTDWAWPDKGLVIGLAAGKKDGAFKSTSVRLAAPATLKTEKGIGIGSSVADVKKAYGKEISKQDSSAETLVVGSLYGGTFFDIADDKVKGIFLGAGAE